MRGGLLQIYNSLKDAWEFVCTKTIYNTKFADVVCKELGFASAEKVNILGHKTKFDVYQFGIKNHF